MNISTHTLRGERDDYRVGVNTTQAISTHTLRGERDCHTVSNQIGSSCISTHTLRGERDKGGGENAK